MRLQKQVLQKTIFRYRMASPQFGIRTLFLLICVTAFALVTFDFLGKRPDESFIYSFVFAVVSAMVGMGVIALSVLFAIGVVTTETNAEIKKNNLSECFHLLILGLFGVGPLLLFTIFTIFK